MMTTGAVYDPNCPLATKISPSRRKSTTLWCSKATCGYSASCARPSSRSLAAGTPPGNPR
ncbi:MAG: hypothetical protein M3163_11925 [Actinomycetota bacterium]|nr:hypothetical protein [Actinomycetota bacterium]